MPDYKEMYYKMVRASEEAIRILIRAQQECEELYISDEKGSNTFAEPSEAGANVLMSDCILDENAHG